MLLTPVPTGGAKLGLSANRMCAIPSLLFLCELQSVFYQEPFQNKGAGKEPTQHVHAHFRTKEQGREQPTQHVHAHFMGAGRRHGKAAEESSSWSLCELPGFSKDNEMILQVLFYLLPTNKPHFCLIPIPTLGSPAKTRKTITGALYWST